MFTLLYLFFWILLGIVLNKIGIDTFSTGFWAIYSIVLVIVMIKDRLTEKDILKKIEDKIKNGL